MQGVHASTVPPDASSSDGSIDHPRVDLVPIALTLLARYAQTDGPSPYEENELEVEVAILGLLYCLEYLYAALDIDFEDLVATAHACFLIMKAEPKQPIRTHLDGPA